MGAKTQAELDFDLMLRTWGLLGLIHAALLGLALLLLDRFRARSESRASVAFGLGAVALSTALTALLAVPCTEILLTQLSADTQRYFVVHDVVHALWSHVIGATDACLLLVLPFAVFYHQTPPRASIGRRALRSAVEVLLLLLVLAGIVLLLQLLSPGGPPGDTWGQALSGALSTFSSVLVPAAGLLLYALTTPAGWLRLCARAVRLHVPWTAASRRRLQDRSHCLALEAASLRQKLALVEADSGPVAISAPAPGVSSRRRPAPLLLPADGLRERLAAATEKRAKVDALLAQSRWRNVACVLAVAGMAALTLLGGARIALRPFHGLLPAAAEDADTSLLGCVADSALLLVFFAAAITGLYHSDADGLGGVQLLSLARVRPRARASSMETLLLHTIVLLLNAYTLPVVAFLLGLSSVDLMRVVNAHFTHVSLLHTAQGAAVLYVALFAASVLRTVSLVVAAPAALKAAAVQQFYAALSSPRSPRT